MTFFIGKTVQSLIKDSNTALWKLLFEKYQTQSKIEFYTNLSFTFYCLAFDMPTANLLSYSPTFLKENCDLHKRADLYKYQLHFDNLKFQILSTAVYALKKLNIEEYWHFQTTNITQQFFDLYYHYIENKLNDSTLLNSIHQQKEIAIETLCRNVFTGNLENWLKLMDANSIKGWQELGPLYWLWFHLSAPKMQKQEEKENLLTLFTSIDAFIACSYCEVHFRNLKSSIKQIYQKHNEILSDTFIEIHNIVTYKNNYLIAPLTLEEKQLLAKEYQTFWDF